MKRWNVIIVLIDALRADALGCYGCRYKPSPNIDKIAEEGVLFKNAFSCAECTIPSLTSIFSGRYPRTHGIVRLHPTSEEISILNSLKIKFLPEILKSVGYTTLALDWVGRWLKCGYDFYYGIPTSKIVNSSIFKKALQIVSYFPTPIYYAIRAIWRKIYPHVLNVSSTENAKTFTNLAIDLIKKNINNQFFLFIHYWDTHIPYNAPDNFIRPVNEGKDLRIKDILRKIKHPNVKAKIRSFSKEVKTADKIIARYYSAIRYVDSEIKKLMDSLENMGIIDNTLIVITSDHGESLIEHEIYFSHHGLYDEVIHVPLIFKGPGIPEGVEINSLVQHVDITPTILDILGIKYSGFDMDGKSLIPLMYGDVKKIRSEIYAEEATVERKMCIRTLDYKYILSPSREDAVCKICSRVHGDLEELYDICEDPLETNNIINLQPEVARYLKRKLFIWMRSMNQQREKKIIKEKIKKMKIKKVV